MTHRILFVVEGAVKEPAILESLKTLMPGIGNCVVWANKNHIYNLYRQLTADADQDIFALVQANDTEGVLTGYRREDFDQVYLFFDYDGHVGMKAGEPLGDDVIESMLTLFDNETEAGKLYISYPMAEALEHTPLDREKFLRLTAKCKGVNCRSKESCSDREACKKEPHYKTIAGDEKPLKIPFAEYTRSDWHRIIAYHLNKVEFLVNDRDAMPATLHEQRAIFGKQLEKYIGRDCPVVTVLSGFPTFLLDYYGVERCVHRLRPADH